MFDTMTATKIVGGFCGAFLVFLLFKLGAEGVYAMGGGGHGGEEAQAYTIAVEGSGGAEAAPAPELDVATILASGDAAAGEALFSKNCKACHKIDGNNSTGPHLDHVVGRPVGSVADFSYSASVKGLGGDWTPDRLVHFLHKPSEYAPKTKMTFKGFKKDEDLSNIVAYLESIS